MLVRVICKRGERQKKIFGDFVCTRKKREREKISAKKENLSQQARLF
jgi:hypothetical protein